MTLVNKRIIIFIILAIFFGCMLGRYLKRVPKRHYCDFRVYHHAAQEFLAGNDIFDRDTEAITPFKYSPFFAFIVSPLGFIPIKWAAGLFLLINFLATLALFKWSKLIIVEEQFSEKVKVLFNFFIVLFVSRFILLNWDSGQVVIIMCTLTVLSLYSLSRGKDIVAAALLAVAILIKYTPAILVPYFIVRKKFKAAAFTILFILLYLTLPALVVGVQKNFAYLASWIPSIISTSFDKGSFYDHKNQSIYSVVLRLTASLCQGNFAELGMRWSMWLAYFLSFLLYLLVLVPRKIKDLFKIDCALLFILISLFSPNGWLLSFVSLFFAYIYLTYYLIKIKFKDVFVLVCLIISFVFASVFSRSLSGNQLEAFISKISGTAIASFILIVALVKLKFFNSEPSERMRKGAV